jgi:hypothetical protein
MTQVESQIVGSLVEFAVNPQKCPKQFPREKSMRKSIIAPGGQDAAPPADEWLDLDQLARVEVTSEDPGHPIECALIPDRGPGWLAARPGSHIVRLWFNKAQRIRRVWLHFVEDADGRTQEFILRWGTAEDQPTREIVRQQWTFSPGGSTHETEDYRVDLWGVTVLELTISPHISGGEARASLAEMRIA